MREFIATPETISAVREEIRAVLSTMTVENAQDILVNVKPGIYSPSDFHFEKEDCCADGSAKITYAAEKGAIIHGGITAGKSLWQKPDAEFASRFSAEALEHIYMIPLTSFGLTRNEWGEEIAIGGFHTAMEYDDAPKGCGSEFFCGGSGWEKRMITARYPNLGEYAHLEAIADIGDVAEFPPQNYRPDWYTRRNHRGGIYIADQSTNKRIENWKDPSTAWMFGYFFWDWADSSTPISVHPETREIFPKFVSRYGARAGALYYLYNVPEELDSEGEYYLDRETGNLYFWPWEGAEYADFSCCDTPLLSCDNVKNVSFSGFTLQCGVVGAISATGDNLIFENLTIKNIRENAVTINGSDSIIRDCELCYLGRGGIVLSGGDRKTLTHANNIAVNNSIHDFAEKYQTYAPAISLQGVGNTAAHNEIYESPHMAILYGGNEHLIEYNYIHDVVKMSNDASAVYGGRDSIAYGTIIRYNLLENVGSEEFHPEGIYWDDALNGQTAFGNILVNIGDLGFLVGGGRDNVVENNIMVNCRTALHYDDRLRDGVLHGGWYKHWQEHVDQFKSCPSGEAPWATRYPTIAKVKLEVTENTEDPWEFYNPSNSKVKNNIAISCGRLYSVADSASRLSDISDNYTYDDKQESGWDENTHNISSDSKVFTDCPEFTMIPAEKIGIIR